MGHVLLATAMALFHSSQLETELLANLDTRRHLHRKLLPVDIDSHSLPTGHGGLRRHHLRWCCDGLCHGHGWGDRMCNLKDRHGDGLRHRLAV